MGTTPRGLWTGARKTLGRTEAIEQYAILRLRHEDIRRLDYLLNALYHKQLGLPHDCPFTSADLCDTIRTCFFGWFASLTDQGNLTVYAFNCLFELFRDRKAEIVIVQEALEYCHSKLHQFRNNVAFHARASIDAHIKARTDLRHPDVFLDLQSAISDFKGLMEKLIAEELTAIPELPGELKRMRIDHHPAFANVFGKKANATAS